MSGRPHGALVRAAREAFLAGDRFPDGIRLPILASWQRSELCGADPDHPLLPFFADARSEEHRLYVAARPILERWCDRLADTRSSIVLADRRAVVLGRWTGDRGLTRRLERASVAAGFLFDEEFAGTNGLGTVLEVGRPVEIVGAEHFAEQFQPFMCVGAPIHHPMTRQIEGVIDIACRASDANRLLLPMAMEIASEIEQALFLHSSERERALLRSFLRQARPSVRPVISISEQFMMANAAAARLLDGTDQIVLWEQASRVAALQSEQSIVLTLADGRRVQARCKPVESHGRTVGVVIELDADSLEAVAERRPSASVPNGPSAEPLIGRSSAWRQVEARARRLAPTGLPVLLVGEPGTGKASLARYLHACSGVGGELAEVDAALAGIDAAGWLRRLREQLRATGGSVLLRHGETLSGTTAATVCSLIDAIPAGGPRLLTTASSEELDPALARPLLDRVGVTRIVVPPLRHRPEDVAVLAAEFARRFAEGRPAPRFTPEALQSLLRLDWPGNVRQLENLVRALVDSGHHDSIRLDQLPDEIRLQAARRRLSRLEQTELQQILGALRQVDGNKLQAARNLGISRSTLYRKLRAFGVELDRTIF
jgi:sigma-54 dependent transcriptional regulator, acetoin dehydrogenase operon transcriptional activator AcoR